MGYESQVGLALTIAEEKKLRTAAARVSLTTLRENLTQLLTTDATRFDSAHDGQVLYFWDWSKWSADREPGIAWLEARLQRLAPETYCYVRLGEDLGDYERDGALDEIFDLRAIATLDFIPAPDQPDPLSASGALLESARQLVAAYAKGEASHSIEWEDLDAAHRLALDALRVLG